jgi:hypothetical protein
MYPARAGNNGVPNYARPVRAVTPAQKGLSMHELQNALLREEIDQERLYSGTDPDRPLPMYSTPADARRAHQTAAVRQVRGERQIGIDTHELLKREAFATDVPACDAHFEKNRPCPYGQYGVSDQYVCLDSWQKLPESSISSGVFRWNFMVQGVTGNQVMGVRDVVDTVIEIEMGSFSMPILEEVPYVLQGLFVPLGGPTVLLVHNNTNGLSGPPQLTGNQYPQNVGTSAATPFSPWINNPYTQVPFGGRFTVYVGESSLQSFSDNNGARHNFEYQLSSPAENGWNPNMVLARPIDGSHRYFFTDPLKDVHGMTLTFRSFDQPLSFLPDVYDEAIVTNSAGSAPNPNAPFIVFNIPGHNLNQGDRFFVAGYVSGISVLDAYVNRAAGHVAAGDPTIAPLAPGTPIPDPNNFFTDPAIGLAAIGGPPPAAKIATVYIAKRRLLIPMRMRRMIPRLTNYITAV